MPPEILAKKPRGPVRGTPRPSTAKNAARNRTRAWKHGLRAQTVTAVEKYTQQYARVDPEMPEIVESYRRAILEGDTSDAQALAVIGMADTELVRRKSVKEIHANGLLVQDDIIMIEDGKAKKVGVRLKANPLLEPLIEINKQLGLTAQDLLISKKSRGEGARDAAITLAIARDAMLRAHPKDRLPPPRKAIATTATVKK